MSNVLLNKICKSLKQRNITGFSDKALESITLYDWPGNIRQLANTIERAVILEDDTLIHEENLSLPTTRKHDPAEVKDFTLPFKESKTGDSLAGQEKELILKTLEDCLWVQKDAAEKLGLSPRALNYRIRKLGITHPHWRRNK